MKEERFPQLSKCGEIRPDWTEQKLQNLGGEHSNWFVEGKMESDLHRELAHPLCFLSSLTYSTVGEGGYWMVTLRF